MTNDPTTEQRPSEPPRTVNARLEREPDDRIIGGVAAGLGIHFDANPWWFRIGFALLVPLGGLGLILYLAGWVLIPEQGEEESIAAEQLRRIDATPRWIGAGLVVLAVILLLGSLQIVNGGVLWAVALLVLGVLLYRGELSSDRRPQRRPVQERPAQEQPVQQRPVPHQRGAPVSASAEDGLLEGGDTDAAQDLVLRDDPTGGAAPPGVPQHPSKEKARRKPKRERSYLGRMILGTAFVVVGIIALLDSARAWEPGFRHYVAALVAVLGVGLVVGAWWGRSRFTIVLGVLLIPVLLVAVLIKVPFQGGFAAVTHRPTSVSLESEYHLVGGDLKLDLRELGIGQRRVEATVAFGRLVVVLPLDVGVVVDGRVGIGELDLLGAVRAGIDLDLDVGSEGEGLIELDLEVGIGALEVFRAEARSDLGVPESVPLIDSPQELP